MFNLNLINQTHPHRGAILINDKFIYFTVYDGIYCCNNNTYNNAEEMYNDLIDIDIDND